MRKWLLNLSGFVLMLLVCGTEHAVACASGFAIQADERVNGVANIPAAYVGLRGEWDSDLSDAQGAGYGFQSTADSTGYLNLNYAQLSGIGKAVRKQTT